MRRKRNPSKDDAIRQHYPVMKAALKRVVASGDPDAIIRHVDAAMARFEEIGYPDQWHDWERAKEDAQAQKRMKKSAWNPRRRKTKYKARKSVKKFSKRRALTRKFMSAWIRKHKSKRYSR